jgi:hypothetical protein
VVETAYCTPVGDLSQAVAVRNLVKSYVLSQD